MIEKTSYMAYNTILLLCLVLASFASPTLNVEPSFDWPLPSESVEGRFTKAAVTTDHGICSGFGGEILKRGGNAVDAAITVMFCLGVTNPQSSGLGGGFLMTLYNKTEGRCIAIDARETAPAAAHRDMYKDNKDGSQLNFLSIATPGELAGYWHIFQNYGSGKVAWRDLIAPSIRLCREGVPVSVILEMNMKEMEPQIRQFPSMRSWINPSTNKTYIAGEVMTRLKLAQTLEKLAAGEDPVKLFYNGEMTKIMAEEIQKGGGILTVADFSNYRVRTYETALINDHFRGDLVMCGGPPPSSFAVTQLIISAMSKLYPEHHTANILTDPVVYHHILESMKFAYAQRTLLGDHDFVKSAGELANNLTTEAYTQWVVDSIKDKSLETNQYGGIDQAHAPDHGTSHVDVLDAEGNAVSATTTINRLFGAVVESETYGIVWNDEMDDFSQPGRSNGFGFAPSETNFIEPGKRPMSSMSPMVIYDKKTKNPRMVVGASGGSKIIATIAKTAVRSLIFNETIKQAIDSPMFYNQFTPNLGEVDDRFPESLKSVLQTKYGQPFSSIPFERASSAQGIDIRPEGVYACGDFRRKTPQVPAGY